MKRRDLVRIDGDVVDKSRGLGGDRRDLGWMDQVL